MLYSSVLEQIKNYQPESKNSYNHLTVKHLKQAVGEGKI